MRRTAISFALLMILAPLGQVSASESKSPTLSPYRAVYASQWDLGLSFSGDAIRELRQQGDNWSLSIKASALIAKISESSLLNYNNGTVQPARYEYHRKVLGRKRDTILQFNWSKGSVLNDTAEPPWSMDIPVGTLDKISYQLQLRLDLINKKKELVYQIADKGQLKTYRFKRVGNETIKTDLGEFDVIKIQRDRGENSKRETFIWLAPELDYLIVKLHQIETDGKEYTLLLNKLDMQ
ncbi:MAG: DUF3108 domain-containing protein [Amphritea sp.]